VRRLPPLALALLLAASPAQPASAPAWVTAVLSRSSPPASDSAHAHVLLDETVVVLPAAGRARTTSRAVIRVLDKRGASGLGVRVPYDRASADVRVLRAWLIAPDGGTTAFGEKDALDLASAEWGELVSDIREKVLAPPTPAAGAVFAWEWTVEAEVLVSEWWHTFGSASPTALERFELELPPGAEADIRTWSPSGSPSGSPSSGPASGRGVPAAVREGQRWRWEARDIPAARNEPLSPGGRGERAELVVAARAGRPGARIPGTRFGDWPALARWHAELAEPSARPAPEVDQLASALCRDRLTALERARAIARHVQGVNYVSVTLGLAHGAGYIPRPAALVLRRNSGDCKDKANLFCAMARSMGLEAWMVSVRANGRDRVHPDWPSPRQFDHAIAALRVPALTGLPAASDSTPVGTLLYFDPTDPYTPFGTLPEQEQGTWALLQDREHGGLVRLPVADPLATRSTWRVEAVLDSNGALHGSWRAHLRGPRAAEERRRKATGAADYRRGFEVALSDWLGPMTLARAESEDEPDSDAFRFDVGFSASRFARRLGGRMLSFRTAPLNERDRWSFTDSTRRTPIALPAQSFAETVVVVVPGGWQASEVPERMMSRTDFGEFDAAWTAADGAVRFTFATTLKPVTVPAERYREVRDWWAARNRTFQAHVVLERRAAAD
jgi:transglutaminase-like putative cysteine protease